MLVIFKNFEIRSSSSREIETAKKKKKEIYTGFN